jgi:hypothetical protein
MGGRREAAHLGQAPHLAAPWRWRLIGIANGGRAQAGCGAWWWTPSSPTSTVTTSACSASSARGSTGSASARPRWRCAGTTSAWRRNARWCRGSRSPPSGTPPSPTSLCCATSLLQFVLCSAVSLLQMIDQTGFIDS